MEAFFTILQTLAVDTLQLTTPACFGTYRKLVTFAGAEETLMPCIQATFPKVLGLAIVLGASIVKVPQALKLYSSKSAEGLPLSAVYTETLSYIIFLVYNARMGYEFGTYGETAFILVQNLVIIVMLWAYAKQPPSLAHVAAVLAVFSGTLYVCWNAQTFLPPLICCAFNAIKPEPCCSAALAALEGGKAAGKAFCCPMMPLVTVPITAGSRLPQIYENFANGHTGQLSFITVTLFFLGAAARMYTTMAGNDDFSILVGFAIGTFFNFVLFAQLLFYWGATTRALEAKAKARANAPAQHKKQA